MRGDRVIIGRDFKGRSDSRTRKGSYASETITKSRLAMERGSIKPHKNALP